MIIEIINKATNKNILTSLMLDENWSQKGPNNIPANTYMATQIEAVIKAIGIKTIDFIWSSPAITEVYPRIKGVNLPMYIAFTPRTDTCCLSL